MFFCFFSVFCFCCRCFVAAAACDSVKRCPRGQTLPTEDRRLERRSGTARTTDRYRNGDTHSNNNSSSSDSDSSSVRVLVVVLVVVGVVVEVVVVHTEVVQAVVVLVVIVVVVVVVVVSRARSNRSCRTNRCRSTSISRNIMSI